MDNKLDNNQKAANFTPVFKSDQTARPHPQAGVSASSATSASGRPEPDGDLRAI